MSGEFFKTESERGSREGEEVIFGVVFVMPIRVWVEKKDGEGVRQWNAFPPYP